jgi:hypothetical protein
MEGDKFAKSLHSAPEPPQYSKKEGIVDVGRTRTSRDGVSKYTLDSLWERDEHAPEGN